MRGSPGENLENFMGCYCGSVLNNELDFDILAEISLKFEFLFTFGSWAAFSGRRAHT